jgi:nitroreductase
MADTPSRAGKPPGAGKADITDMTDAERATVDRLLTTTRSVRKRLDLGRPVPIDTVMECLRLAIQAPTGSNVQGWRWIVVTDPAIRASLADLYQNPTGGPARHGGDPPVDDAVRRMPRGEDSPQQRRVMDSARFLLNHIGEVPVLVVPCTSEGGAAAGWQPSIYPAVWSFMLALRSRGLGSCLTTSHLFRREEAAHLLGIPPGYAQACLVPVAFYTGHTFKPAHRRPVEEITYLNSWGNTVET